MPQTSIFVRYAIYTRQSVATDLEFSSCDAQFEFCHDAATRRWGSFGLWDGQRYDDEGVSGANVQRPALDRLMERVRSDELQAVAVYRLDRLARNIRDCLNTLHEFKEHGVDLFIATAPHLGFSAADGFLLNVMAAFAEFERDMIKSRLADSRAALKRRGRRIAGRVPHGYDVDPRTRQFVVNRAEARQIVKIFEMAAQGTLPSKIAKEANRLRWRTKVTVARSSKRMSGGGPWTPRQVLSILANPVYMGAFADGDKVRPGQHEPIVSEDLFLQAGQQVESRRVKGSRRDRDDMLRRPIWALQGRVICSKCGRLMSTHETRARNCLHSHYRCRSHAGGSPPCRGSSVAKYELEKAVDEFLADPDIIDRIPDADEEDRRLLHYAQTGYALLDQRQRMCLVTWLVKQVVYDSSESTLAVTLDMETLRIILRDDPKTWPFAVWKE